MTVSYVRDERARRTELSMWLQMTVPLEMQRLANLTTHELQTLAVTAVPDLVQRGDVLEFGGNGCGRTAAELARALACAALVCPGGVNFAELHWCTDHTQCGVQQ